MHSVVQHIRQSATLISVYYQTLGASIIMPLYSAQSVEQKRQGITKLQPYVHMRRAHLSWTMSPVRGSRKRAGVKEVMVSTMLVIWPGFSGFVQPKSNPSSTQAWAGPGRAGYSPAQIQA